MDAAYLIQRDSTGQLQVDLQRSKTELEAINDSYTRLLNHDHNYLATNGIFPVFAHGVVVALACGPIRRSDILLIGECFDLVLRACSDASTFSIVGVALMPKAFHPLLIADACDCWQADAGEHAARVLRICLEVTKEEAFADQLIQEAIPAGSSDCASMVSYLTHHAIGSVRKGSYVQDVTAHGWQDEDVMGPSHLRCSAHQSSELHRVLRNPLWFTLLSGGNKAVRVLKPPRSRTASISSSEWVTEEE